MQKSSVIGIVALLVVVIMLMVGLRFYATPPVEPSSTDTKVATHKKPPPGAAQCDDCHGEYAVEADAPHGTIPCSSCHRLGKPHAVLNQVVAARADSLAREDARRMGRTAYRTLYDTMSTGWDKEEVDRLMAKLNRESKGMTIRLWRGRAVADQYGPRHHETTPDTYIEKVFATAMDATIDEKGDLRYLYPIRTSDECLACHTVPPGSVNGIIEVIYPAALRGRERFKKLVDMPIERGDAPCLSCHQTIDNRLAHIEEHGGNDEQALCRSCHPPHDQK